MRIFLALSSVMLASSAHAQVLPQPEPGNPRIQRADCTAGQTIELTVLAGSGTTLAFEPGEQLRRIVIADERAFDVRVADERRSAIILPLDANLRSRIDIETDRRHCVFDAVTGSELMAAWLVQVGAQDVAYSEMPLSSAAAPASEPAPGAPLWSYGLRGDVALRPDRIIDDGATTWVTFAPDRSLPAIFAIGPTGEEQVVDGHMRGDVFVIDRVHEELVFRIDREKATAKRQDSPEQAG